MQILMGQPAVPCPKPCSPDLQPCLESFIPLSLSLLGYCMAGPGAAFPGAFRGARARKAGEGGQFRICFCADPLLTTTSVLLHQGEEREVLQLGQFQYFGERALLKAEPRGANVKAKGKTTLLTISRFEFDALLGPLELIKKEKEDWIERGHVAHEMMMQRAGSLLRTPFNLSDLQCTGILFTEGVNTPSGWEGGIACCDSAFSDSVP